MQLIEVLLAIIAVCERVQRKAAPLRLKRQQMRSRRGILDQVIHPSVIHLNVGSLRIELHIFAGLCAVQSFSIQQQVNANRILGLIQAHH